MHIVWKISKGILFFLLGLILLLFVAGFFLEPVARRMLLKEVNQVGEGQYSLQLEDLSLSLLQGNIRLKGIRFLTDTAAEGVAPVVFAEAGEFSAEGVSWLSYLTNKRLSIERVHLSELSLRVKARSSGKNSGDEPFELSQLDIYPKIKDQLRKARVEDLSFKNIDFTLINIQSRDTLQFIAGKLDVESQDILIEAEKLFTENRAFYAQEITLDGEQLQIKRTGNRNWEGETEKLLIESRENILGFSFAETSFLLSNKVQDTLLFTSLGEFSLEGLDVQRLQAEKVAALEKLSLHHSSIYSTAPEEGKAATSAAEEGDSAFKLSELSLGNYLPSFIAEIELEALEIEALSFRQKQSVRLSKFALSANDIRIDKGSAFSENRLLHALELESSFDSLLLSSGKANHQMKITDFSLQAEEGEGSLSFNNFALTPPVATGNSFWVKGNIEAVKLASFNVKELVNDALGIGKLSLQNPRFSVQLPPQQKNVSSQNETFSVPNLNQFLNGAVEELWLEGVDVQNGSLRLASSGQSPQRLSVPEFHFSLEDVLISDAGAFEGDRVLHSKDIRLQLKQLRYHFPDKVYVLEVDNTRLSTGLQSFILQGVRYEVEGTPEAVLEKPTYDQLYSFANRHFEVKGLDYQQLLQENRLYARQVSSAGTELEIFGAPFYSDKEGGRKDGQGSSKKTTDTTSQQVTLANLNLAGMLPPFLKSVEIGSVDLQQVGVRKMRELQLQKFSLKVSDLLLDGKVAFAGNRFFHARKFRAGFDSLWLKTGKPAHNVQAKGFSYKVDDGIGQLEVEHVLTLPLELSSTQAWLEASLAAFKVEDINTRNIPAGELTIGPIRFVRPEWIMHLPEKTATEDNGTRQASSPDFYPLLGGILEKVHLSSLEVVNGKGRFSGLGGSTFGLAMPEINLVIDDILIGKGTAFSEGRILHSRNGELMLGRLIYVFPDKVYSLQLEDARLSTRNKSLGASSFQYMYGGNFMKIIDGPETNEVYRVLTRELQAKGINFQRLFSNEGLFAEEVAATGLDLYVFKDLNKPEAGNEKPMPADMLRSLKMPLSIEEVNLKDGRITYEEMTEGADSAGLVTIEEVAARFSNVTNIRSATGQKEDMIVTASGSLMGRGLFKSEIQVPIFNESENVRVKGSLDTLDITILNRISRYNSRIAIESGTIYEVGWDFEASAEESNGEFQVSYENLSVQLSDAESPDTTGVLKDIGSFLANALIVDSSIAEEKSKEPKKVSFKQKREKERSFFHYYVQSLLAGFLEAIGVPFQ